MERSKSTIILCPNSRCDRIFRVPTNKGALQVTCSKCNLTFTYDPDEDRTHLEDLAILQELTRPYPPEVLESLALYRCHCNSMLKVMTLRPNFTITCPSCNRIYPLVHPCGRSESFLGVLTVTFTQAMRLAREAARTPINSVCDLCHVETPKERGFVATQGILLAADPRRIFPYLHGLPKDVIDELARNPESEGSKAMLRYWEVKISADPTFWLLCVRCASVVFASAIQTILTVSGTPEVLDMESMKPSLFVYLSPYRYLLQGEAVGES